MGAAISGHPGRAIGRRAVIAEFAAILAPFPDIAVDLIKPPRVRPEAIDGQGSPPVFAALPAACIDVIAIVIRVRLA